MKNAGINKTDNRPSSYFFKLYLRRDSVITTAFSVHQFIFLLLISSGKMTFSIETSHDFYR